jgi:CRP-like cAMP-binding protein
LLISHYIYTMMDLVESLITQYHLSEEDLEQTMRRFEPEMLPARSCFLEQGKVADRIGFLKTGLLRSFIYDDQANDITTHFFVPGTVVISMESFNNQVPSNEYIVTLEDSELLVISFSRMQELYRLVPVWRQIAKDVDEMKYNDLMNRSIQLQTMSATERYLLFCENNRVILQKVALKHIASYLGIDIATLSRIRRSV